MKKRKKPFALPAIRVPRAVVVIICALPAALTALFYILYKNKNVMDWVAQRISSPIRGFFGMVSSIYPFSVMEILCTVAVIWLLYYIIKTIVMLVRMKGKLRILLRRVLTVAVLALYVWSTFCWLWNSGYYATRFAAKNGFKKNGITATELADVTRRFADKANELSKRVKRDDGGHYIVERSEYFDASKDIYKNIAAQYPSLGGKTYVPKPMMHSWLMSLTGYSGVYFALTGESNVNKNTPGCLLPSTVAHELAHQHGVFAEDEANFVAIATCATSGNVIYEYSGYLMGLMHLLSALYSADNDAYLAICGILSPEVVTDWQDNNEYWEAQKTVHTGIAFIDKILTALTGAVRETTNTVYDSYLKTHNQELGLKSYGACVDLLVEYFLD